jgi:hypothetical protein
MLSSTKDQFRYGKFRPEESIVIKNTGRHRTLEQTYCGDLDRRATVPSKQLTSLSLKPAETSISRFSSFDTENTALACLSATSAREI